MENLFVFLATSLVLRVTSPRFRRYIICPGCSALLNTSAKTLNVRYTKDGDKLLFNNYVVDGVTYGIVCVQMKRRFRLKNAEQILSNFINRVRKPLQITCNTFMDVDHYGHYLTITDYWQDANGIDWKIKGYTNGKILSLLYVKNINDTTTSNHDGFLNGFRISALQQF